MSIAATSAILALARKPLNDIYESGKSSLKKYYSNWKAVASLDKYKSNLHEIDLIRTINCQNSISLTSIYYPSRIILPNKKKLIATSALEI
ncbi:hypothetical protein [Crenobacter cavernae]|uniref:hypothetical protein n=1 Tax=Crenobacter cavernae TaxID=2290923 RepID=UPI0011C01B9C|nr:hypothetical protein [Crenobacter cavernae]